MPAHDADLPQPRLANGSPDPFFKITEAKRHLGKQLFHDPVRMVRIRPAFGGVSATAQTASCASCHMGEAASKAGTLLNFAAGGEGRHYTDANGNFIPRRRPRTDILPRLRQSPLFSGDALVDELGFYAGWLFSRGTYETGLIAALVSLGASILDGCDGELARLQSKESALGCWIDTIGDYTYYLAIFAGLTIGAVRQTNWPGFHWIGVALGAGTLLTFALLIVIRWRVTSGRPDQLRTATKAHFYGTGESWARFVARLSNCATRAMMPYGIVAFAAARMLPAFVVLAAFGVQVYWISLATQLTRLLRNSASVDRDARCDVPVGGRGIDGLSLQSRP